MLTFYFLISCSKNPAATNQKIMSNATQLIYSIPTDLLTGALSVPIYQTSTFERDVPDVNWSYDYARSNNPTRAALALENVVANLKACVAAAFSSG